MGKKYQNFLGKGIFFLVFLCLAFFCLTINKTWASSSGLEVNYPPVGNSPALAVSTTLPAYVLYLFNAGMLLGFFAVFISLVIAGVMWLISPAKPEMLGEAKDRIGGAISGLLILIFTYLIITTINPELSFLKLGSLSSTPPPTPAAPPDPGIYLYKSGGCSGTSSPPQTASIKDLSSALRNQVNSIGIAQDLTNQTYYVSILYGDINFQGECQVLEPTECQDVDNFASSVSIHAYNRNPENDSANDGVYFYRKAYFNEAGGYYKVTNAWIKSNPYLDLDKTSFQNVPSDEQDCAEYDNNGKCARRTPPTLGGGNIASVKINGNYIVLFVYVGPKDELLGPWTSCQEFPTVNDVNKTGPKQIKWENIMHDGNFIPNYVVIIPVMTK